MGGAEPPLRVEVVAAQEVAAEPEPPARPLHHAQRQGHQHSGPRWASADSFTFLLSAPVRSNSCTSALQQLHQCATTAAPVCYNSCWVHPYSSCVTTTA